MICGGDGPDTLYGGGAKDWIDGGASNDDIHGGAGDDTLDGGLHLDSLRGDNGRDTCISGEIRMSSCELFRKQTSDGIVFRPEPKVALFSYGRPGISPAYTLQISGVRGCLGTAPPAREGASARPTQGGTPRDPLQCLCPVPACSCPAPPPAGTLRSSRDAKRAAVVAVAGEENGVVITVTAKPIR